MNRRAVSADSGAEVSAHRLFACALRALAEAREIALLRLLLLGTLETLPETLPETLLAIQLDLASWLVHGRVLPSAEATVQP